MNNNTALFGRLVLVSTPIGNLGDMTYRGVEALKAAATILCEDTRHTRKLLNHYDIQNELVAYHDHNKERVTPGLVERLKNGEELALVSDAGTPGISDPGFYLARQAIAEGISVTVVPGANAILSALLLSGFPTDAFIFDGFLPKKKSQIERCFAVLEEERRTVIRFVSPYQLVKALKAIARVLPERTVAVVREITKIHEEAKRGTAAELAEYYGARKVKGEIVLLLKGAKKP
jgi:16S rRNA (cytidine1402-2'-O)-methyltransferase